MFCCLYQGEYAGRGRFKTCLCNFQILKGCHDYSQLKHFCLLTPQGGVTLVFYVGVMVILFHPFRVVYFICPWFYNHFSPSGFFTAERSLFLLRVNTFRYAAPTEKGVFQKAKLLHFLKIYCSFVF